MSNAAVNGHLELTLLKDHQRFDAISTSNLEVCKFRDWWIFTYFIFGYGESSPNNIWSMVNLKRTCVLLFYYFLYLKVNLDLEKTNQLGESSPNFVFALVNLDPIILVKRWIDGESWPNDFVEKVNRGKDLIEVGRFKMSFDASIKANPKLHNDMVYRQFIMIPVVLIDATKYEYECITS